MVTMHRSGKIQRKIKVFKVREKSGNLVSALRIISKFLVKLRKKSENLVSGQ